MIQMYHVTKHYPPGIRALTDVNLQIDKGEFVFITGPSGAGKSTLLRLIFRGDIPSSGQILVNGRNVTALPESKVPYLRRTIGVVFQDFKLIQRKTVFENIAFILNVLGVPYSEQRRKAYQILKLVGLHHRMNALPNQLSGGEQQRVSIARALINHPSLLIADEPTGNLDPDMARDIIALFEKLNFRGTTVIVATHNLLMVEQMRKRTVRLEHGRVTFDSREEAAS
ncbi:MAG TPA: cell division ATP-binding protein FtsE [Thermoanaerobaculia bacterium]|nr:cell division ATP-binding protein FtsE [Thermoanaerobaculia bacterium]HUM30303.1 cell division ATP-binding protein FtsE [Thermoanaerobaculia bacterium]HXK68546.1 cell division ATP-binding protein FtsE [Thermoanaerobaculia bacterium]